MVLLLARPVLRQLVEAGTHAVKQLTDITVVLVELQVLAVKQHLGDLCVWCCMVAQGVRESCGEIVRLQGMKHGTAEGRHFVSSTALLVDGHCFLSKARLATSLRTWHTLALSSLVATAAAKTAAPDAVNQADA